MSRYIVVDFETYPIEGKSFIMEIGCVEVVDGKLGKEWSTLIRPVIPVSDFVLNLTGMSQSVLDKAPEFLDVITDFYGFVANSVVVAHNANIDRLSFDNTCAHFNQEPRSLLWVDSQDVIKLMDPTTNTLQLQALLKHYRLNTGASHRALSDAHGLAQLMLYYTAEKTLVLTKKEVGFLKQSPLSSITTLIKFLLQFFTVNVSDEAPVADRPILNSKHTDDNIKGIAHSMHYTNTEGTMLDAIRHDHCDQPVMVVTNKKTFLECIYIPAASKFIFPDKIYRLYPLITDIKASHIELVEIYAIIN